MRDRAARGLILVLDENLSGKSILGGLRANGLPVKAQTELMKRGISDKKVLAALAKHRDHYLLSKDSHFYKKPGLRRMLTQDRLGAFVITGHGGKAAPALVALITKAWPGIQRCVNNHDRPFVAKIVAEGRVEVIKP